MHYRSGVTQSHSGAMHYHSGVTQSHSGPTQSRSGMMQCHFFAMQYQFSAAQCPFIKANLKRKTKEGSSDQQPDDPSFLSNAERNPHNATQLSRMAPTTRSIWDRVSEVAEGR